MAATQRFRSAFNGFNREDVVNYIEYLNNHHAAQVQQLNNQLQEAKGAVSADTVADLQAQLDAALARVKELETQLAAAPKQNAPQGDELEAYRRAERLERTARERSSQLYRQATSTLAEATGHVDTAAGQFRQLAARLNAQICEMQIVVESSKNALTDAAATMYAIRPEGLEE